VRFAAFDGRHFQLGAGLCLARRHRVVCDGEEAGPVAAAVGERRLAQDWNGKTPMVSVRNVVPTLTSSKRQGLSLNGRC
jgi:hypothetical protein